ncbi:fluoride efflux transporter FluC [Agromyces albus]|uniref:Fluoride-specific ion channel FluC n=1 Tax=Agromyces albus TaxID=205332 RepID=A0A4Q2KV32_9MICO|nr:CrcB family protein [Agromyces albus]RXZ68749.1 CrcB family protein [Agromyces albus]
MRAYLAVAVGGLIGTGLRLGFDLAFPHADGELPVETFVVNLFGSFALGWLVGGLWTRPGTPTWLKAGLGSGLIGSFTTLSAVMVSLIALTGAGELWLGVLYLFVSVVGGLALAAAGLRIGSIIAHRPMPTEVTDAGETL